MKFQNIFDCFGEMPGECSNSEYLYAFRICDSSRYIQTALDVALDEKRPPGLKKSERRIEYTDRYQELSKLKEDQYVAFDDYFDSRLILSFRLNCCYRQMVNWLLCVHSQLFTCYTSSFCK